MLRSKKPPSSAPSFGANRLRKRGRKPPPHPGQESPGAIVITPRRSTIAHPGAADGTDAATVSWSRTVRIAVQGSRKKKKSPMTTRIFSVEYQAIVRAGLRAILARDNWRANATSEGKRDIEVVGESGYGRTAVDMVRASLPDGVVVGVALPELNGIETARQIPRRGPRRNGGGPCR